MAKRIPLTQGKFAIVDDADYEWLNQWKWHFARQTGYAARKDWSGGKPKYLLMHRVILNAPKHLQVDHINGDGLDNRRCNIRLATAAQNSWNQKAISSSISEYKGVSFYDNRFVVRIFVNGGNLYFGGFTDECLAARIYDFAAVKYYGEYARLNFPDQLLTEGEFEQLTRRKPPLSKYRGVTFDKRRGKWIAYIQVAGKYKSLGKFDSELDAARAYNEAAPRLHGSKAKLNDV